MFKKSKKIVKKATKKSMVKKTKAKMANKALLEKRLQARMTKKGCRVSAPKSPLRDAPSAYAVDGEVTQKDLNALKAQPPIDNDHVAPGCEKFSDEVIAANKPKSEVKKVTNPGNDYPLWPDAKCGECHHDASNDPNGDCYLYKLECPSCGKVGCDECMPAGRGCPCPDCEQGANAP